MTKKVYTLVSSLVGGLEAVAVALVTYFAPEYTTAINTSIVIAGTAVVEICAQFLKNE